MPAPPLAAGEAMFGMEADAGFPLAFDRFIAATASADNLTESPPLGALICRITGPELAFADGAICAVIAMLVFTEFTFISHLV